MSEPVECETCGRDESDLCDDCRAEQWEVDERQAEFLFEEDLALYTLPLGQGRS